MSSADSGVGVRRVTAGIGAEVTGVLVGPDLPAEVVRAIRGAVLEHKVLFFRGQHQLDDAGQAGFAGLFGELARGRGMAAGAEPESFVRGLDSRRGNRAGAWHTDVTYTVRPTALTMLRAGTLPEYGGNTVWANAAAAYQGMSAELRELADGLRAVHGNDDVVARRRAGRASGRYGEVIPEPASPRAGAQSAEHPVVRVHPETGERSFLLGVFAKQIVGRADSAELIDLFQGFVTRPENVVWWRWEPGDMVVWDNRATQHYAVQNYGGLLRTMHRVTTVGDVPVGVDGRPSVALDDSVLSRP